MPENLPYFSLCKDIMRDVAELMEQRHQVVEFHQRRSVGGRAGEIGHDSRGRQNIRPVPVFPPVAQAETRGVLVFPFAGEQVEIEISRCGAVLLRSCEAIVKRSRAV